jgi:hypothetical protein
MISTQAGAPGNGVADGENAFDEAELKTLLRRGAVALPREFGAGLRVAGWRAAAALWRGSRAGLRLSGCRGLAGLG